ncbi:MAG: hypothetical protein ABR974_10495 [Bacteroidales bacterium]
MRLLRLPVIAALMLISVSSCWEKGGKYIDQGEIHYTIEYIKSAGTMSAELKPRNLVVSFKSNKILFEIMAPIGNQGIVNVVNPESEIYDTYINMLGVRYYYAGSKGEIHPGFSSMEGVEITKTDKIGVICGYDCKNAIATFPADRNKKYSIWYTDQIKVKNSNSNTPFSSIDGVLLSFYYILGGSEMKFQAETVYKKDIPDKAFERKPKFRPVSKKDMDKIITDMVNL